MSVRPGLSLNETAAGLALRLGLPALAALGLMLGGEIVLPVLHLAANRLVVGTSIPASAALGPQVWAVAGLAAAGALLLGRGRAGAFAALLCLAAATALFAAGLGEGAARALAGQPPAARARLAAGAWIGLLALAGGTVHAAARTGLRGAGALGPAVLLAPFALLCLAGSFDSLSLAVEYRARSGAVQAALLQHAELSAASVVLAALACIGLALWRPIRRLVDLIVNGLQVVPAVALLGTLVALTSGLLAAFPALRAAGLSALGPGPAVLAITAYLLLPLWRGLHAALRAPDPATLDAATAIGLTSRQILARVRLPLGAPILIGALRVACVQSIGLATLGALVGAGGLGTIVFDGMAQFAPDLILLGAIPIVALSLAVERALSWVEQRVARRLRG